MKVAFLGLGIMGSRMAANLARKGHEVTVWNRTPKDVEGARTAADPRQAADGAEVVWMCVSDTAAVEQVLFGENGAEASLREGMIVVDSSTISPVKTVEFAQRVRGRGGDYVDAPMTGSKIAAEGGQLIFMVGGAEPALERIRPLFEAMGKAVKRMGDVGKGQATKLCMNLIIAVMYEGFAEALTLAAKQGVHAEDLIELIGMTMVRSGVVDYKGPFVLRNDFSPNFPLRLMYKDIRLALEAAKEARVKLPALRTVEEVYEVASEEGLDDFDYAATLTLLQKWAGLEIKGIPA